MQPDSLPLSQQQIDRTKAFWDLVDDLSASGSDVFVLTEKGRAFIKIKSNQWSKDEVMTALVIRVRTLEAMLELSKRENIALRNKQSGSGEVSRTDGS